MRRFSLTILTAVCAFIISCTGDTPDDCAFQAQDGTCAVVVSSSGALECRLDDADLCDTMTTFLEDGEPDVASTSSALVNTGTRIGGTSLRAACEPDGTFMCTCCSVKAGCYPCPKKVSSALLMSSELVDTTDLSDLEISAEQAEVQAP